MDKPFTLLTVLLIFTLPLVCNPVQGKKPVDDTLTIPSGGDEVYKLESNEDTEWTFKVNSERPVNLKWFDQEDYDFYQKGESKKIYPIDSKDNVTDGTFEKTFKGGTFYFLILNEYNRKQTNVTVKVSYEETPGFTLPIALAGGVVALLIYQYRYRYKR